MEIHGDTGGDLGEFRSWLATEKPEQIVILDDDANFTHLDNVIEVTADQVRMTRPSHRLVVVSRRDAGDADTPTLPRPRLGRIRCW